MNETVSSTGQREAMTNSQIETFKEIRRLMAEMHVHWQENADDFHHKSGEGEISVHYPNWFAEGNSAVAYMNAPAVGISIYSYLFGPNRTHSFYSFSEALTAVREWHEAEMANTYD
jgi:S-formylglutathione hydrolase FrmB